MREIEKKELNPEMDFVDYAMSFYNILQGLRRDPQPIPEAKRQPEIDKLTRILRILAD